MWSHNTAALQDVMREVSELCTNSATAQLERCSTDATAAVADAGTSEAGADASDDDLLMLGQEELEPAEARVATAAAAALEAMFSLLRGATSPRMRLSQVWCVTASRPVPKRGARLHACCSTLRSFLPVVSYNEGI